MDDFSWFVGIFEGEGSISGYSTVGRSSSKRWELAVKMCDEDTIQKVAAFLGVGYSHVTHHLKKHPHWSPSWAAQLRDREKLWFLGKKMYPYLSFRRQKQWDLFFCDMVKMAEKYKDSPIRWRYNFVYAARLTNVDATAAIT